MWATTMDYLRQIEEDIRNLGLETKRYPEIKDATDRALDTIKVLRDHYISDIRKSNEKSAALSQSSDVSAPYILLLNYADVFRCYSILMWFLPMT